MREILCSNLHRTKAVLLIPFALGKAENERTLQLGMVCESTLEDEDWYSYCTPDEFEPYPEY